MEGGGGVGGSDIQLSSLFSEANLQLLALQELSYNSIFFKIPLQLKERKESLPAESLRVLCLLVLHSLSSLAIQTHVSTYVRQMEKNQGRVANDLLPAS